MLGTVRLSGAIIVSMAFCLSRIAMIWFRRCSFVSTSSLCDFSRVLVLILSLTALGTSVINAISSSCLRAVTASFETVLM